MDSKQDEILTVEPTHKPDPLGNQLAIKSDNAVMMEMFERLASNPSVDPAKMKQFLDMQEHVLDRNAQVDFNAAMVRAQNRMQTVNKNAKGQNSRYANLEAVLSMCRPIYTSEGFAVTFAEGFGTEGHPLKAGCIRMVADIMHESGHTKTVTADVPLDDKGPKGEVNKTGTQATGSSFSYGRRYLNCMIWNIDTGDDTDGSRPQPTVERPSPKPKELAVLNEICQALMDDDKPEGMIVNMDALIAWHWNLKGYHPPKDAVPQIVAFIRTKAETDTPLPIYQPRG